MEIKTTCEINELHDCVLNGQEKWVKVGDICKILTSILYDVNQTTPRRNIINLLDELSQSNPTFQKDSIVPLQSVGNDIVSNPNGELSKDKASLLGRDTLKCECGDMILGHACPKKLCRRCCLDRCLRD